MDATRFECADTFGGVVDFIIFLFLDGARIHDPDLAQHLSTYEAKNGVQCPVPYDGEPQTDSALNLFNSCIDCACLPPPVTRVTSDQSPPDHALMRFTTRSFFKFNKFRV